MLRMRARLDFTRVPLLTTLERGFSYLSIGRARLRLEKLDFGHLRCATHFYTFAEAIAE